jgi:hypothetical protein
MKETCIKMRRTTLVVVLAAASLLATFNVQRAGAATDPLRLVASGPARHLKARILGASSEPLIEPTLVSDPAKLRALQEVAPADLRFPGGSQSNFYDWRTGLLEFHSGPQSSAYIRFWVNVALHLELINPDGGHFEQFAPFAKAVGADVILVPNLETSTVEDQVAWFQQLKKENILPTGIELGNEYWIAMGFDLDSLKRWPDSPTAMSVMHRYEQALRPIVGPGAKFAVQSSGSAFWVDEPSPRSPLLRRQIEWDAALKPADWFEAVTIHLYTGLAPLQKLPGADTHNGMFRYMMARADAGIDRVVADLAKRLPGKEIWVTEWSPGGGAPTPSTYRLTTPPMVAQGAARMVLAYLRHPEITKALYFTLNFQVPHYSQFVHAADGSWKPDQAAQILTWFDHAANAGANFQRVVEPGAAPIAGDARVNDSYLAIEGGVFKREGQTILIIQNAGNTDRSYDPRDGGRVSAPASVEILATPDLNDQEERAAIVRKVTAIGPITLPALSVMRVVWAGDVAVVQ